MPIGIPTSKGPENINISPEINIHFEEIPPFQDGVISEIYQRSDKSFFPRTLRIGRSSQYRQSGIRIVTKTGSY